MQVSQEQAASVDECLFLEATSRGPAPITGCSTGLTAAQTYLRWGSEDQKNAHRRQAGRRSPGGDRAQRAGRRLGPAGVRLQARRDGDADLATDIAFARSFVYDVAHRIDAGQEDALARESAMAKMRCTEIAKTLL